MTIAAPALLGNFGMMFALPFMQRALLAIVILAIAAGVVGLFIHFRELEFVSDGLVHAVFPGLVIGMLVGGSALLLPGAAVAAGIAAVLFSFLGRSAGGRRGSARGAADAGIAVVLTGLFSVGVVLVSRQESYVSQLQELLFGRILTVSDVQLAQMAVVAAVAVAIIAITRRAQLYRAFDLEGFEASGFRPLRTDLALNLAVALLVVAGVQALGVLMVVAILVVPMAVARLITNRLGLLIPIAILVTILTGFAGLWIAFEWSVQGGVSVSPGAVIVLVLVLAYGAAVGLAYLVSGVSRATSRVQAREQVKGRA